jgi:hypothetical protein
MDAAEDREVKLQRASGDLVSEFSAKLPSLLWRAQTGTPLRTPRRWAQVTKTEKLVSLVRPHRIGSLLVIFLFLSTDGIHSLNPFKSGLNS